MMKDTFFTALAGIGAGIVTTLLGGWDIATEILLIFIVLDYITGMAAAWKTKTIKSSVGFEGLMKKGAIFLVVILAAQLDRMTGNSVGLFRTSTCFFFVGNEGISFVENIGEMGVKLPAFIAKALAKLRDENNVQDDGDE